MREDKLDTFLALAVLITRPQAEKIQIGAISNGVIIVLFKKTCKALFWVDTQFLFFAFFLK